MKKKLLILTIAMACLSTANIFAQPGGGGGNPGGGLPPGSTSGPIDSGAVFLLVAVATYGYFKLKKTPDTQLN